jgi:hypothetical protein
MMSSRNMILTFLIACEGINTTDSLSFNFHMTRARAKRDCQEIRVAKSAAEIRHG